MIRKWILPILLGGLILLAACTPVDPLPEQPVPTTEPIQLPVAENTPLPTVEEILPLPTISITIPQGEVDMVIEKVRPLIAEQLGVLADEIRLLEIAPVEWPDGCLGLASPDEMCIQVITPGYRLLIEVNGQTYEVRTDQNGDTVRINRELNPQFPREVDIKLPARCQQEGMKTYVDLVNAYCFAYPADFITDPRGLTAITAQPENPANPEEVVARLDIFSGPATAEVTLDQLVSDFRKQFEGSQSPVSLRQTQITLDGQPAHVLEPIPGRLSSRMVFALHNARFYQLIFFPLDESSVESDFNRLYEVVISTFTFLP